MHHVHHFPWARKRDVAGLKAHPENKDRAIIRGETVSRAAAK